MKKFSDETCEVWEEIIQVMDFKEEEIVKEKLVNGDYDETIIKENLETIQTFLKLNEDITEDTHNETLTEWFKRENYDLGNTDKIVDSIVRYTLLRMETFIDLQGCDR